MRGAVVALMCAFLLACLGVSAKAADYSGGNVWYRGDCCHRERVVGYEPEFVYAPFSAFPYIVPLRPVYMVQEKRERVVHFKKYNSYANAAAARCHWREAPVRVDRGLWVWGGKTTCY